METNNNNNVGMHSENEPQSETNIASKFMAEILELTEKIEKTQRELWNNKSTKKDFVREQLQMLTTYIGYDDVVELLCEGIGSDTILNCIAESDLADFVKSNVEISYTKSEVWDIISEQGYEEEMLERLVKYGYGATEMDEVIEFISNASPRDMKQIIDAVTNSHTDIELVTDLLSKLDDEDFRSAITNSNNKR